jgi:predicted small secreted protein
MDKIRAYYLEGRKLPNTLIETVENLEKANGLLCHGYSREQAVKFLMESKSISKSQGYKVIREALELFGDVTKSSKEGLRHIVTEGLMQVVNHAKVSKNLEMVERAYSTIARINGLYASEESAKMPIGNIIVNFTNDAAVLHQDAPPTVDIPHIEV